MTALHRRGNGGPEASVLWPELLVEELKRWSPGSLLRAAPPSAWKGEDGGGMEGRL